MLLALCAGKPFITDFFKNGFPFLSRRVELQSGFSLYN